MTEDQRFSGEIWIYLLNWRVSIFLKVFETYSIAAVGLQFCGRGTPADLSCEVMTYHFVWFRNHTVWAQMRLNHLANVQLDKDVCLLSDCSWSWAGGLEILGWVNTSQSLVCSAPWTVLVYFQTRFYVFLCVCFSFWWYASTEVLLLLWGCNLTSSFLLWDKTMSWIVSISPWYDSTTLSLRPNGIWDEFIFNLMMTPEVKTTNTNLWCTNTNTDPSSY